MARYYAGPQRQPNRSPAHPLKQWAWVMGAFVSGYFLSALYDVASFNQLIQTRLLNSFMNKKEAVVVTQAPLPPPKPKLEFYTLLAKGEPGVIQEASAMEQALPQEQPAPQEQAAVNLSENENPSAAVVDTANQKAPVVANQAQISPPVVVKPGALAEKYNVQLAAFNNRADAEKMKAALLLKGFTVSISLVEQHKIQWYRVNLGPFSNRGEAEAAQHAMVVRERISGMIRKESA